MPLKSYLKPYLAAHVLSQTFQRKRRAKIERLRQRKKAPHRLDVFHDPTDPYSVLLSQVLPKISDKYKIDIHTHLISPPDDSAHPERELLHSYAREDAARLARKAKIPFEYKPTKSPTHTITADALLKTLGHYQGGMIHYGGEWYWGLDRLHYLETRLTDLEACLRTEKNAPLFIPPIVPRRTEDIAPDTQGELHWYFSFRSPYSAISADRIIALANAYSLTLKLRFVLPMVMRGLPVPPAKKQYIPLDTAREARHYGVPFGKICDPLGAGVERGYAILHKAISQDHGLEFVQTYFRMVWSEGVNASSDHGLRSIVKAANLDWETSKTSLKDESWRTTAEANRTEMMSRGIWGVPSFRIDDFIVWGQDRLWAIEDELERLFWT